MIPKPLTLSKYERDNLKVLYLAKYAGNFDLELARIEKFDGIAPKYHREIREIITNLDLSICSSNDFDYLISQGVNYNYIFSVYNRAPFRNSEILCSAICEYLKIAYLGAAPHIRSLAEDKHLAKIFIRNLGILTPKWRIYKARNSLFEPPDFCGPYFIKPRFGASSEGIDENSIQISWHKAKCRVEELITKGIDVMVEEFIPGKNITMPVIGHIQPWILPCMENISNIKGNILSFRIKRLLDGGLSRMRFYNNEIESICNKIGMVMYKSIEPVDYFRVDFRYNDLKRSLYFLEFNICSNLGSHSTISSSAREIDVQQKQLLEHIITFSIRRQKVFG